MTKKKEEKKKKEGEYQKYLREKKEEVKKSPLGGRAPVGENDPPDGLAQKSKDHKRRNLISRYGIEKVQQMEADEKERQEKKNVSD